jgi:hypothetical protein
VTDHEATRRQLMAEVAHWRSAVDALADLDAVAAPAAWAGLEDYLRLRLREPLRAAVAGLAVEAVTLEAALAGGGDLAGARRRVLGLRQRYFQVETILDFYGDAVATRTNPRVAAVLRGLDTLAADSLDVILRPLGIEAPPTLVYLDKGLGASILKAGVRLWDQASVSPVAAVKLTRHNLGHPTAVFHEIGHQAAHQAGWVPELAEALAGALGRRSRELADVWAGWASEVAADVHAFAQAGWAPLPALANVVDGTTAAVYRLLPGDPHPFPWIRVMFHTELCRSWYGAGPWDALANAWGERHPPERAPAEPADLARASVEVLSEIVDICTRRPMAAFQGRPLCVLADPRRVSPAALDELARRAGPSLLTSQYLSRREPLRIVAWLATRVSVDTRHAAAHHRGLQTWLARLGGEPTAVDASLARALTDAPAATEPLARSA